MRDCGVVKEDSPGSEKSIGEYLVCVGGYPVANLPSFSAAAKAAQARMSKRFGSDDDFSIYEIETGIHFDVPHGSRLDDSFLPAAFELTFNVGLQIG